MNTENLRRKIITRLNGSNIDQLADLVESHEGPFLRNQNGEILRDISDGIEEQEERSSVTKSFNVSSSSLVNHGTQMTTE